LPPPFLSNVEAKMKPTPAWFLRGSTQRERSRNFLKLSPSCQREGHVCYYIGLFVLPRKPAFTDVCHLQIELYELCIHLTTFCTTWPQFQKCCTMKMHVLVKLLYFWCNYLNL
jgi:hypothetical protein